MLRCKLQQFVARITSPLAWAACAHRVRSGYMNVCARRNCFSFRRGTDRMKFGMQLKLKNHTKPHYTATFYFEHEVNK